jgi:serine/threonine protein phosphatase 1
VGRLFAIGDIHGCYNPFKVLITETIALKKADKLILLGDYIDRGTESREVIDFILDLKAKGYNITPLMGNHEAMLLASYSNSGMLYEWYMNSGETTLQSFGIEDIMDLEKKYLDFFMNLRYFEQSGDFLFVHAGFNDFVSDPFGDTYSMIWESQLSYSHSLLKGKTIVHGHRPKTLEYVKKQIGDKSSVIPVDTGCVYGREAGYGFLSALDVNKMQLYSVEKE